ncbi:MAG: sugar phosphate isomerase/epimerase [Verrucomicrobia bacterium]|nr:sugar phosphate isomerase/epimerase [Verrucomicrobiota bacterium]
MSASAITDLSRLCVHTATTKPWSLSIAAREYARAGIKGITVWRDALAALGPKESGNVCRAEGLEIVSLCRGGFFPHVDQAGKTAALDDNRRAIDEAAALGAPLIVLVCGAHPSLSLETSRKQIVEGIAEVLPYAHERGIKLGIEPLHPMYAGDRSAVNTLRQANDMCDALKSPYVGVALDVYHLWWDPELREQTLRCGKSGYLFAFHVCDWRTPTRDLLLDRAIMGDGCINIPEIRGWVEEAGFKGFNEVEIFSTEYWSGDQSPYLQKIVDAYRKHV